MVDEPRPDIPGAFGSGLMVLIGAGAIWAARDYSDLGAVFPRTVGALLVALGIVYIALVVLGPLGFLPSGVAAMASLLLISHHGRWTLRTVLTYGIATAAVLGLMYALFQHALQVPLP